MSNDFDTTIDDVAREMTSAPVDANLARRVVARIADGETARRSIWTRPGLLAPLAAACVIVVAVFVAGRRTPVVPAPIVVSAPEPTAVQPVERADEPRSVRITSRPRAVPLPPLREMDVAPLAVERLDVMPIVQAEQIQIDPIAIAHIDISPMP
jgi:hypothetical protein